MKNVLLPLIGLVILTFGLITFVVFKQKALGIIFMCTGILFQVLNYIFIVKDLKRKKKSSSL
jgi:hypothetical protein